MLRQLPDIVCRGVVFVYQNQCLFIVYRRTADLEALQTALVDQPAGGEFDRTVGLRIERHIGMPLQQGGGFFRADDGVFKETADIAQNFRVG